MTPNSVLPLFSYSIIIANVTPSLVSSRFIRLPSQFHPLVCFVSEVRPVPLHYLFSLASCQGRSFSLYNSPLKATLYKLFMPFVEAAEKDRLSLKDVAKVGIIFRAKKRITYFGSFIQVILYFEMFLKVFISKNNNNVNFEYTI